MLIAGESTLISVKHGTSKKTGNDYYQAKFLDSDAEEYAVLFISEELFHALESMPKHAPVLLTLNLSLDTKYFSLVSVEPIETN